MNIENNKVQRIYDEIERDNELEYRREYDLQQLAVSYNLTDKDAQLLLELIQENFTTDTIDHQLEASVAKLVQLDGLKLKRGLAEYLSESQHGSWDGYTRNEVKAINAFLKDLVLMIEDGGQTDYFDAAFGIADK